MTFTVVIPARFSSSRLPGKPLADIGGKPMVQHVWERARESGATRIIVATDDQRVFDTCEAFGADACMTAAEHESGTDRINEVISGISLCPDDVVVNVQGDEPLMPPENIRQVAELAAQRDVDIATLHVPVESLEDYLDPNAVKLVCSDSGDALYFSRAPIPWNRDALVDENGRPTAVPGALRHLGIYAYRVAALQAFSAAPPAMLETIERLEQLRALAMGLTIRSAIAARVPSRGVDTPADLEAVRALLS